MSGLRVLQRLGVVLAALLVVVLVVGLGLSVILLRRPLPDHDGAATLGALGSDVEVIRDERGIPQVYADTDADLFRAQGYVHAQDRFFEMDYRRHVTSGRLSELVGENEEALAADSVIRTFGWRRIAEQEWDLLSEEARGFFEAYAEGVNAYLDTREASQLGVEYTVLGFATELTDIEPWDPIDSLAWLKAMAWDLAANIDDELGRAAALRSLGGDLDRVAELYPELPEQNLPILPADGGAELEEPAQASEEEETANTEGETNAAQLTQEAIIQARAAVRATPQLLGHGDGIGSNSFAIAGEHTASGEPLLANDPHLGISAPGIWHQVGLHCRSVSNLCSFDVSGFSFAGMPGVVIGHNAELSWGLTNLGADVIDFYLERVYDDGTYLYDGERVPLERRNETIAVNGEDDVSLSIAATEHGPIVSGVLPGSADANNTPVPDDAPSAGFGGYAVAMSWTALEPGHTGEAIFAINRAADADDIAEAAELFEVPAQNIVFATTDGHIGYQAPGTIPVREDVPDSEVPTDGTWPQPGWDSDYDWTGTVPSEDMPRALDPPEGFIVAANQAAQPIDEPPFLTTDYDYGYRAQRIRDLIAGAIENGEQIDAQWASDVMMDTANPYAEMLVPLLLEVPVSDPFVAEARDLLSEWQHNGYRQDGDEAAAAYFAAVWAELLDHTFSDELPDSIAPTGGSRWLAVIAELVESPDSDWWDDRRTVNVVESRDEILLQSMTRARNELTNRLGKDPESWRWSHLHHAAPTHPVLGEQMAPIRSLVNPSPIGVSGGTSIVNATGWDAAKDEDGMTNFEITTVPSMRMIVDMADLDASRWVNLTGNSGHPAADNYTDQLQAWADGETFAWPFSREAVEEAEAGTQQLEPGG